MKRFCCQLSLTAMKYLRSLRYYHILKNLLHNWFFYYLIPDSWEIRYHFKEKLGYSCHLRNPRSFNEKIQWIKLHDRNPLYPKLTDKVLVKGFVAEAIGSEYVIPTLAGGFSHFDDIPFDKLPNQFVLKCNHDSKSTILCTDKSTFDFQEARPRIERLLRRNYYHYKGKQWGYKDIRPCVFVEKYMTDGTGMGLRDYKFLMFNGECKCVFYYDDRFSRSGMKQNCYDGDWNLLPFSWGGYPNTETIVAKPRCFEEMKSIATKLAAMVNNAFVRIDLYEVGGNIYFGEFTFYPGSGFDKIEPVEWDFLLGSWIDLKR